MFRCRARGRGTVARRLRGARRGERPFGAVPTESGVDHLRAQLRAVTSSRPAHGVLSRCDDLDERLFHARNAFPSRRFKTLYRRWKQNGDWVLADVGSHVLDDAVKGRLAQLLKRRRFLGPTAYSFGGSAGECQGTIRTAWESIVLLAHGIEPTRTRARGRVNRDKLEEIDLHWHDLRREAACRWLARAWICEPFSFCWVTRT